MLIKFDFNNMMERTLGKRGFTDAQLNEIAPAAKTAFDRFAAKRGTGMTGWADLPYNQDEIVADIVATAARARKEFDNFVVLGIGGSALGPIAVFTALCHFRYNDLPAEKRGGPKFFVEDNVDPERMLALLDVVDVKRTLFNVVTKSGATSETMSQYLIISDILKKAVGEGWQKHIVATTSESKGNLIKLAKKEGFKTFFIPDGVGGRFSELCPVGLFPAAMLGIDVAGLLKGAADIDKACSSSDMFRNSALMAAALQFLAMKDGKNISVMMPYADSLKFMADWYCQLWAESLGKAVDLDGKTVNAGQTPVKSLGVTDQHSQVQLYTEGPFDKVITIIGVEKFRGDVTIADGAEEFPDVNFLCGHTMGELINTERRATEYALTRSQHMNNTITLPEINAETVGQLLMFFQLQTAYCGEMLNVDTFNQPGVEEGKNATYALFERKGYEAKRAELDAAPAKLDKYII